MTEMRLCEMFHAVDTPVDTQPEVEGLRERPPSTRVHGRVHGLTRQNAKRFGRVHGRVHGVPSPWTNTGGVIYPPVVPPKRPIHHQKDQTMTTSRQDVDQIIEAIRRLDPRAVHAEVAYMTGARVRSANLDGVGSRNAEQPLPLPDKVDRWVRRKYLSYQKNIASARAAIDRALFEQSELLVRLHDDRGVPTDEARELAAEDVSPKAVECLNCRRPVERTANDRLRAGRCQACNQYLRDRGVERPESLWAAA